MQDVKTSTSSPESAHAPTSYLFIVMTTAVATLGGFLFGYDTAVIAGAIRPLTDFFGLNATQMGFAAGCAIIGCIGGAAISGMLSSRLGRKKSLLIAALLFMGSAIGSALPDTFTEFVIFRIIGGIGVGIASMVSPMYIAEMAPARIRGTLVSMNQMAIVIGIFLVYFVNYFIAKMGDETWNLTMGWRWMFGSETIPAGLFFLLLFLVPESPRWLVIKNQEAKAEGILRKVTGDKARTVIADIRKSLDADKELKGGFSPVFFKVLLVGIALSAFQQVTGINAFLYYAPEIFKGLGSSGDTSMLQTILVGGVNMIFTLVAIFTVDKFGRKPLMIVGALGMCVCLLAIGAGAYMQNLGVWLVGFVLGYIAFFALSLGPVVWVLLAEIFPNSIRSVALSIAVAAQWISNYSVVQLFPVINKYLNGALPFGIYAVMCILTILFTWFYVPETKGKTLEEMEQIWNDKFGNK